MTARNFFLGIAALMLCLVALPGQTTRPTGFRQTFTPWAKLKNGSGHFYYQSDYTAFDMRNKVINQQVVWYFPYPPEQGKTDWSLYWVYWYSPSAQVLWARCPTPHHPRFKEWEKAEGKELWQIIPEHLRIPGETSIAKLGPLFGPILGSHKKGQPLVQKDSKDVINCVDFKDAVFN